MFRTTTGPRKRSPHFSVRPPARGNAPRIFLYDHLPAGTLPAPSCTTIRPQETLPAKNVHPLRRGNASRTLLYVHPTVGNTPRTNPAVQKTAGTIFANNAHPPGPGRASGPRLRTYPPIKTIAYPGMRARIPNPPPRPRTAGAHHRSRLAPSNIADSTSYMNFHHISSRDTVDAS
jgi:hypothetical protein